jgi:hypothetical protein
VTKNGVGPKVDKIVEASSKVVDMAGKVTDASSKAGPLGHRPITGSIALSATLALVLFFAARAALELQGLPTSLRVAIALVPLPALAWFLWTFVREIRATDELERQIQLEALAVAFPLTLLLIMILGLLQIAVPLNPDDWSYRHIWPLIYVFYLFGVLRARRRYE